MRRKIVRELIRGETSGETYTMLGMVLMLQRILDCPRTIRIIRSIAALGVLGRRSSPPTG
jgi:hypothetical protein